MEPSLDNRQKLEQAFEEYCRDPVVAEALVRTTSTMTVNLLKDAFMRGAHYVARLKAEQAP